MKLITPNKLDKNIVDLLNSRLKDELDASFFYRAVSNWCSNIGYKKAGVFFDKESNSELEHAKGIESFLIDWNIIPQIPTINKPGLVFEGLVDIINQSYQIELDLYEKYNINSKTVLNTEPAVFSFLQKYLIIQAESVAEYSDLLNSLALINSDNKFELFYWEGENF